MDRKPIMTTGRKAQMMRTSGRANIPTDPQFEGKVSRLAEALRQTNSTDHMGLAQQALLFLAANPDAALSVLPGAVVLPLLEPAPFPAR